MGVLLRDHISTLSTVHITGKTTMEISALIKGLHHVTATVEGAKEDYDFYTGLLGLRLIKETVNFDNENVYHFYYANENGLPSTVFTTFPYKDQGVRKGTTGTGQVVETTLSVPEGALSFWRKRLQSHNLNPLLSSRFNRPHLLFRDPSGLIISISEDSEDKREPVWATSETGHEVAIRGIHHVTLAVQHEELKECLEFLTHFGYRQIEEQGAYLMLEAGDGGAGNTICLMADSSLPKGINGIGTVHHVAHRVSSSEQLSGIKKYLEEEFEFKVTDIRDRKYFRSIYFRIPGGVLFEIASNDPGFLVDESLEELGSSLKLPEWQEPRRKEIEKGLSPYR